MRVKKKLFSMILIGALFMAALLLFLAVQTGSAQNQQCPPGQEEANGCKWAQHQVTGNCMWLPANSVSGPWVELPPEVPRGYCPPLNGNGDPTATATTDPGQPTATATTDPGQPTATATTQGGGNPTQRAPTPGPHPPREQPGGPGNLGYIVFGSLAGLGLLALAAFALPRVLAKKR
jgi:hypothetical protein